MTESKPYSLSVKAVILDDSRRCLLLRRADADVDDGRRHALDHRREGQADLLLRLRHGDFGARGERRRNRENEGQSGAARDHRRGLRNTGSPAAPRAGGGALFL